MISAVWLVMAEARASRRQAGEVADGDQPSWPADARAAWRSRSAVRVTPSHRSRTGSPFAGGRQAGAMLAGTAWSRRCPWAAGGSARWADSTVAPAIQRPAAGCVPRAVARQPGDPDHRHPAPDEELCVGGSQRAGHPGSGSAAPADDGEHDLGRGRGVRGWRDARSLVRSRRRQLDCLPQAREYQEQGHANVRPWIDTSVAALATPSAKQIAREAIIQNSLSWLERAKQAAAGDG